MARLRGEGMESYWELQGVTSDQDDNGSVSWGHVPLDLEAPRFIHSTTSSRNLTRTNHI